MSGVPPDTDLAPSGENGMAPSRSRPRSTRHDAFELARRWFLAGRRLDMGALAEELGISRATLYRWTGPREKLLGEVIRSFAESLYGYARLETSDLRGAERLLAVFELFVDGIAGAPPLRRFLEADLGVALRVLTSRDGVVHPSVVAATAELMREEAERGAFEPRVDIETLAFAVTRVTEAFLYNEAIMAVESDAARAKAVIEVMLD